MAPLARTERTRVDLDFNARAHDGLVRAGYEDFRGPALRGERVVVFDREERIEADALVVETDDQARLAFLHVEWDTIRDTEAPSEGLLLTSGWGGVAEGLGLSAGLEGPVDFQPSRSVGSEPIPDGLD